MGCKSNIFVGGLAVVGIGLGGYAAFQSYMNQPATAVEGDLAAADLSTVAGVAPAQGDEVVELAHMMDGGNTQLMWHTGKMQAGSRHDFEGTFSKLSGAVLYNAESQTLKAIQANVLIDSLIGAGSVHPAPPALTNTVRDQKWFDTENHPEASFESTDIVAFADASEEDKKAVIGELEGATHLIKGSFKLNGKTESVAIPAKVVFSGPSVKIALAFDVSREAYGVDQPMPLPATTVDDVANVTVEVNASPDPTAVMAELAKLLGEQQKASAVQTQQIASLESTLSQLGDKIAGLERDVAKGLSAAPTVSVSDLPKTIKLTEPLTLQEYELVLIPGDEANGIDPFYMSTKEVTWDQYKTWAFGEFTDSTAEIARLRQAEQLPSPPYGDMSAGMGFDDRPAIRMSRLNAQRFTDWLSSQTGLAFRLPTEAEWDHAFVTTQGPLDEVPDNVDDIAWNDENADFATQPVGSKEPNSYGIYDLLGNAFEWVTDSPDGERVVRGASYWSMPDEVKGSAREIEVMAVWNDSYPNQPKSKWWFVDRIDIGIRLIVDANEAVKQYAAD